jgi:hypothetical protein
MLKALILQPHKSATQSGQGQEQWILQLKPETIRRYIEPIMGWTGSFSPSLQVRLKFSSLQAAQDYAQDNHISYEVVCAPLHKKPKKNYAQNFL